ncbi:hypothetical protein JRO89_XS14G0057100 [Xanthoceras sorbifolium]|uniref:Uncharacterized protein n=1 Tax=Xanthoceras sorbifolium TaxID=99658 RepID=A0ABQ8H404_9ROSI|nr:hypothetical protein JRO89_XS14G0057100 [Xanthoceras sorbifolium]
MATSTVMLTLIIDKRAKKIILAKAGKDFVDIMSSMILFSCFLKLVRDLNRELCTNVIRTDIMSRLVMEQLLNSWSHTWMVMDDLCVKPVSMISGVDLLQHNIKDICALEKRVVEFGIDEEGEACMDRASSGSGLCCVVEKVGLC